MEEYLKDVNNSLRESQNSILSQKELRFVFKIALHSKRKKVRLTNLLLQVNNMDITLEELREDVAFKVCFLNSDYVNVIQDKDDFIMYKLTESGRSLAENLDYDISSLKFSTFRSRFFLVTYYALRLSFIILVVLLLIALISVFLAPIFYKPLRDPMLYVLALVATPAGVLAIKGWNKSDNE